MNEAKATVAVFGGVPCTAIKSDGTSETLTIRCLPVKELNRFFAAVEDELELAEIYCDRPQGWAENLSGKSLAEIIGTGQDINTDFFCLFRLRIERQEKALPGITAKLAGQALANGLPK